MIYLIGVLAVLTGITGCAMKEAPPLQTYTIEIGKVAPVHAGRYRNKVLKVSFPQTLTEPLTDQMAFSYSSSDRGYYQNSQWSNNLGKLIQGSVIVTLQQSGLFKAVLPAASSANEDLRLESVLYDFSHHVRGEDSYAVVSIAFNLIDTHTGKLLKSKRFSYREPTPTVNAEGYVAATNKALHRLVIDLIHWLR
jgi:cholesterol transport system auxiliary component